MLTSTANKKIQINRERELSKNELLKSRRPSPIYLTCNLDLMGLLLKWKEKKNSFFSLWEAYSCLGNKNELNNFSKLLNGEQGIE